MEIHKEGEGYTMEESKKILGLCEPFTIAEIKEAYAKMLSKYHPDDQNI